MTRYPEAYLDYLVHFHADRDWFECHEILEEYWKEHPDDPKSRTWVGLIQTAVGLYHERRGNRGGARKMLRSALGNADDADLAELGIDASAFRAFLAERLRLLEQDAPAAFADPALPIADERLLAACVARAEALGLSWNAPSDLANEQLVQRHTLRDRSGVIEARLREAERRREQRGRSS